jgi:hypothetical protein
MRDPFDCWVLAHKSVINRSFKREPVAHAPREGAVSAVHAGRATDMPGSNSSAGMTAPEAAAVAGGGAGAVAGGGAAALASCSSAACRSIGCHGCGSERDSPGQDDCSVQLDILHVDPHSVIELTVIELTHLLSSARMRPLRSAPVDADIGKSNEPTGSRCSVIGAISARVRNSVMPPLLAMTPQRSFRQGSDDHRKRSVISERHLGSGSILKGREPRAADPKLRHALDKPMWCSALPT